MNEIFRIDNDNKSVVIQSTIKEKKSPLSKALQEGYIEGAQEIIEQTHLMGGQFSLAEQWQIKVFQNSDFSNEEFLSLNSENKRLAYMQFHCFNYQ